MLFQIVCAFNWNSVEYTIFKSFHFVIQKSSSFEWLNDVVLYYCKHKISFSIKKDIIDWILGIFLLPFLLLYYFFHNLHLFFSLYG